MLDEGVVAIEADIPKNIYWALKANGIFRDDFSVEIEKMSALRFFKEHKSKRIYNQVLIAAGEL